MWGNWVNVHVLCLSCVSFSLLFFLSPRWRSLTREKLRPVIDHSSHKCWIRELSFLWACHTSALESSGHTSICLTFSGANVSVIEQRNPVCSRKQKFSAPEFSSDGLELGVTTVTVMQSCRRWQRHSRKTSWDHLLLNDVMGLDGTSAVEFCSQPMPECFSVWLTQSRSRCGFVTSNSQPLAFATSGFGIKWTQGDWCFVKLKNPKFQHNTSGAFQDCPWRGKQVRCPQGSFHFRALMWACVWN